MCDCSAEWAIGRPLRVDVDPLVVVGGIGEQTGPQDDLDAAQVRLVGTGSTGPP
jgi:hypothetical protein